MSNKTIVTLLTLMGVAVILGVDAQVFHLRVYSNHTVAWQVPCTHASAWVLLGMIHLGWAVLMGTCLLGGADSIDD